MLSLLSKRTTRRSAIPRARTFITIVYAGIVDVYRYTLGKTPVKLTPGIHLRIPGIHKIYRADLREQLVPCKDLNAYTLDNVPIYVSGTLYYTVVDSHKACFAVGNLEQSISQLCISAVRALIGKYEYDEINSNRQIINCALRESLGNLDDRWGVTCNRFEIQEIRPQNENIKQQLELQVSAERARRENELNTRARITTAEGDSAIAVLKSQGDSQAIRLVADAEKYRAETEVEVKLLLLERLTEKFGGNVDRAAQHIIELGKIEQMAAIASGPNNSTYALGLN